MIRTRHLAEASDDGLIKLVWQMAGSMQIEQDQRSSLIERGQATVCDTARPYRIRMSEHSHFAVFMLPYAACPGWVRSDMVAKDGASDGAKKRRRNG